MKIFIWMITLIEFLQRCNENDPPSPIVLIELLEAGKKILWNGNLNSCHSIIFDIDRYDISNKWRETFEARSFASIRTSSAQSCNVQYGTKSFTRRYSRIWMVAKVTSQNCLENKRCHNCITLYLDWKHWLRIQKMNIDRPYHSVTFIMECNWVKVYTRIILDIVAQLLKILIIKWLVLLSMWWICFWLIVEQHYILG